MATTTAPPAGALITAEMFDRMETPDRCELVQGRIVPMAPPPGFEHGEVEANVCAILHAFVKGNKLGRVAVGEVAIRVERDPDTVRGADLVYVSKERDAQRTGPGALDVAPDLVVEVLSPSNTVKRVGQKLGEYFAAGVRVVWLVDASSRSVTAYRSLTDVRRFGGHDVLPGDDVLPGFAVDVASLFE